jgi:uncharacterized membrane protein
MSDADDPAYGLLRQTSGIEQTRNPRYAQNLPLSRVFAWLGAGWRNLWVQPLMSLAYGFGIFLATVVLLWTLVTFGWDYILFPALSGLIILGPVLAAGLYDKSQALAAGETPSLGRSLRVRPRAGGQIFFIGLLLSLVMLLWMRAAVLIYALFFGYRPFPGMDHIVSLLLTTPSGWAMIVTGTFVGGLFAAFSFAISVFSVPMMLNERTDAVTAMGTSMTMVWNNLRVMIAWGAVVLVLLIVCGLTALLGLIVIFPLLGHATWHAYRDIRRLEAGEEATK